MNGLGKTTELEYGSSAQEMLDAAAAGNPWAKTMPTVTQVVKRVTEKDNVTIAGRPPATYVTEYSYRDPVYEGRQREFRGFSYAEVKQVGDANSPTSRSASYFLLGECEDETSGDADNGIDDCSLPERWRDNPKEALKGLPYLTESFDENGVYLSTTHNQYHLRRLYTGLDGREVRYAFQSGTRTFLYDNAPFTPTTSTTQSGAECEEAGTECFATVQLEITPPEWEGAGPDAEQQSSAAPNKFHTVVQRSTLGTEVLVSSSVVDFFGNQVQSIAGGRENVDEVITQTSIPSRPANDPTGWLWRTVESFVTGSVHTERRNIQKIVYDENGDPRRTLSELDGTQELDRAELDSVLNAPYGSNDGEIRLSATDYDDLGNPTLTRGANLRCASVAYDEDYQYLPVTETIFTRGCGQGPLTTSANYDRGLGLILSANNVQGQTTLIDYDGFGRMTRMYAPDPVATGAPGGSVLPSLEIEYFLPPASGQYHSYIHTKAQDGDSNQSSQYLESWAIIDGFGRTITTLAEDGVVSIAGDQGTQSVQRWIVGAMQEWDQKSAVRKKYLEFYTTGDPRQFDFGAVPPTYYGRQRYDAFGRQLQTFDLDGTITLQSRYHALSSDTFDAADLGPGPHAGTPLSTSKDGHGRTLQVIERFKEGAAVVERITETEYLPTGEPLVIYRKKGQQAGTDVVSRWFVYDTMGRMVLNVEPNTSPDYDVNDRFGSYQGIKAWRYRYNDAGDLVGTSDARTCGANFFYDGAGRLLGEDYAPCLDHHADYTAPSFQEVDGDNPTPLPGVDDFFNTPTRLPTSDVGYEVTYLYDEYQEAAGNQGAYDGDCNPAGPISTNFYMGRLVRVQDLASQSYSVYDGRGRVTCVASRVARPYDVNENIAVPPFDDRYTPRWYGMRYAYDAADRVVEETTGVRTPELLAGTNSSVFTQYNNRGVIDKVTSSYDLGNSGPNLISRIDRTPDNLVTLVQYGDLARTATTYTYDDRRRVHTVVTARGSPDGITWPVEPSGDGTYQMVLQDEQFFYDSVNNPIEIRDNRIPEEWPDGAKPVSKKIQYDDLYRAKRIDYTYTAGDDTWVSPHEPDLDDVDDLRRARPSPHVEFAKRILWQTYAYDWLGNNVDTRDDANGFYDRSLGNIDNGTEGNELNDGPYQLRGAALDEMDPSNSLTASYDASGNLITMFVRRNGGLGCAGGDSCSQSFLYLWDELGRLVHAKRWDGDSQNLDFNAGGFDADLEYVYGAGDQRVIKTATEESQVPGQPDPQAHTLYVYPSLELRWAAYGNGSQDYTRDGTTEVGYLFANGVRLARLVNRPNQSDPPPDTGGDLRVFFELGDHLGSTSAALDKETSELVERATYQAYGGKESDYRPGRWGDFREDYGFTGKEEDVEVGLVYFGKRFYNPALQRWVSADPLEVHGSSSGDANVYSYVAGMALKATDPNGLQVVIGPSFSGDARETLRTVYEDFVAPVVTALFGGGDAAPYTEGDKAAGKVYPRATPGVIAGNYVLVFGTGVAGKYLSMSFRYARTMEVLATATRQVPRASTSAFLAEQDAYAALGAFRRQQTITPKRNIALGEYAIDGAQGEMLGVSGKSPVGTASVVDEASAATVAQVPGAPGLRPRPNDAERKILEGIREQMGLTKESEGLIRITTERPPCDGCVDAFNQFRREFPGIRLEIKSGPKVPGDPPTGGVTPAPGVDVETPYSLE